MNNLLGIGDWLAQNWMLLVLIVLAVALLVPTYLRQKKEAAARNELYEKIKKGTKIITTAGVYGVVDSVENTTDGKVVTIVTGNAKNPTTMTIHINAIGGIDNKTAVVEDMEGNVVENKVEPVEEVKEEVIEEKSEDKVQEPKKTTKKSTKKSTK